jgi:hypothetical protein
VPESPGLRRRDARRAAERVLREGRSIIYLVPEISLTGQVVEAIRSRFHERAADPPRGGVLRHWRPGLPAVLPDEPAAHLKNMPVDKLSNSPDKSFMRNKDRDVFFLKEPYHRYWRDPEFRALVRERVEYAEARYWNGI